MTINTYWVTVVEQLGEISNDGCQQFVMSLVLVNEHISDGSCDCGSFRAGSGIQAVLRQARSELSIPFAFGSICEGYSHEALGDTW